MGLDLDKGIQEFLAKKTKEEVKPIEEGDVLTDIKCIGKGKKGDGMFKYFHPNFDKGYMIIVPEAELGKYYDIKINAIRGTVSFGIIVKQD